MIEGALVLAAGVLGSLSGLVVGRRWHKGPDLHGPEPLCTCEHYLSSHDPETGVCHDQMFKGRWMKCACRQYVGPKPADQFFTTDIAWGTSVMKTPPTE